jgi:hypothetical protein
MKANSKICNNLRRNFEFIGKGTAACENERLLKPDLPAFSRPLIILG